MTMNPADLPSSGFIERLKNFVRTPQAEWERVAVEPEDGIAGLYAAYVVPLALLSGLAAAVVGIIFARHPWPHALVDAALHAITLSVLVFAAALITNVIAPLFGSQRNSMRAHKLIVYSAAPALLAGVVAAVPALSLLGLAGLYALALLFIGLPRMMGTPELKRVPYMALILALSVAVLVALSSLAQAARAAAVALPGFALSRPEGAAAPRPATVNTEALERGAEFRVAVNPERLEGFLPASLPSGYQRGALATTTSGSGSETRAEYVSNGSRLEVIVAQFSGAGAVNAFAQRTGIRPTTHGEGLEVRTETLHGRLISEESNTATGTVRYAIIGVGVALVAQGSGGATIDEARAALETIGIERLERALR